MKKIALTIICVLAMEGMFAQSHSFRDTLLVRYEQFDYDAWVIADPDHNGKTEDRPTYPVWLMQSTVLLNNDVLQYNYTDNPAGMEVVGLSAAVHYMKNYVLDNVPAEYLLLYEATPDSFVLKAQMQWFETDTAGRPDGRYLVNRLGCQINYGANLDTLAYGSNSLFGIKIFDLYFDSDKPIVVYDSFYVGGTCRGGSQIFGPESLPISESSYLSFRPAAWAQMLDTQCYYPSLWKLYNYEIQGMLPTNQWYWLPSNQFLMVLPIIKVVDTSFANAPACPKVSGLFLRGNWTDTVTMQWNNDSLHNEFEVRYGREGTAIEDLSSTVLRNTNRWQFTDTAYREIPMVSYVRTVCREYDTLRWSGWSYPMYWRLHHETPVDTSQHEGFVVPDDRSDLSRFVRLMPNPASESVVVMSSYGIKSIEVYDIRGERVIEQDGNGTSTGFNVSKWPKGAYVVLVHTPMGTAAKRLLVGN